MFFSLSSLELGLLVFAIVLGTTLIGAFLGRRLRIHADALREPVGVLQAALLGLVALILAFGLTLAVGRYDARRTAVVATANAIGTTYLRAQTLREPMRTRSLDELVQYTDATIRLSRAVPGTPAARAAIADGDALQRTLWRSADEALVGTPTESAPRLAGDAQRDDRHADGAGIGAEQPCARRCPRDRGRQRVRSGCSPSTSRSSRTACRAIRR